MGIGQRLERIALWKKFTCLGFLCLAATFLPSLLYWEEVQKDLAFAKKEQEGLPQVQLVLNVIQRTQQHRALCAKYLQTTLERREQRMKAEEVDTAIFAYEAYLDKNPNKQLQAQFAETVSYWHKIRKDVSQNRINYLESFEQHSFLVKLQLQFLRNLVDSYQLSLDPDVDGYFLIDASLVELPELAEVLGQIRGYGTGLLTKGEANFDERAHLKALLLLSKSKADQLSININKAVAARSTGRENIYANYQSTKAQYDKAVSIAQLNILDSQNLTFSPDDYYASFTLGVNSYFAYAHFAIEQLSN